MFVDSRVNHYYLVSWAWLGTNLDLLGELLIV